MSAIMLLCVMPMYAIVQTEVPEVDLSNPNTLIGILTPLITLGAVWALKKGIPAIQGIGTLVVVPVVAGIITALSNWLGDPNISWILQLLLGSASVFFHQIYVKLTEGDQG